MDLEIRLRQAISLLQKVHTQAINWGDFNEADHDLLINEIELFLKYFQPLKPKKNAYKQVDIEEAINEALGKKSKD